MTFKDKVRPMIGVISTQTTDTEQRRFLNGMISEAIRLGYDTAVISNIFNPFESIEGYEVENRIYDLIVSPDIDAYILILESFVNKDLPSIILDKLRNITGKPVVAVGTVHSNFTLPGFIHMNTDDEFDFEDITDHLIEKHGFTDIDFLSGKIEVETSHLRVNGYRRSLEKHGIEYREEKVRFGTFWFDSGREQARRYISGESPFPQAVICANDYMAYGMLDEFLENGVHVPEDITVIGFENVGHRLNYSPILTTYCRNRTAIGVNAVRTIHSMLSGGEYVPVSVRGTLIHGNSCSCGISDSQLIEDLRIAKTKQLDSELNLFSLMDQKLTECKSIPDFISVMSNYSFLIRDVSEIYFCLLEKWFDEKTDSETVNCFPVMSSDCKDPAAVIDKQNFGGLFALNQEPAVYYFSPMFFSDRFMGYTVLRYDHADDYENIFRSWLKSVSNALELLRMKNDIRYLTQCQNAADNYDSITGLFNINGFENAVSYASSTFVNDAPILMVVLKTEIFPSEIQFDRQDIRMEIANEIADVFRELIPDKKSIYGRINNTVYACAVIGEHTEQYAEMLVEKLRTLVVHKTHYVTEFGIDSFICLHQSYNGFFDFDFKKSLLSFYDALDDKAAGITIKKAVLQYREFRMFRDKMYLQPNVEHNPDALCRKFDIGLGHFRHIYKNLFDISFNQDCISAKMYLAQFLLLTTSLNINEIAEKCGYIDEKYFMRLFRKSTGCTTVQYREKMLSSGIQN